MHARVKPDDVFEPVKGLYAQIVVSTAATQYNIAGTLPYDPDGQLPGSLAEQASEVMRNIGRSLAAVGLEPGNVVRINIFTTDMDGFLRDALDIVFGYFGPTRPSSTLVEVSRLANPKVLVEIEAVAVPYTKGPGAADE